MSSAPDRQASIQAEFRTRRARQLVATVPVILVFLGLASSEGRFEGRAAGERARPWSSGSIATLLVIVGGAMGFALWNWRCPSCAGYLGRAMNPRHCPGCGVQLR